MLYFVLGNGKEQSMSLDFSEQLILIDAFKVNNQSINESKRSLVEKLVCRDADEIDYEPSRLAGVLLNPVDFSD